MEWQSKKNGDSGKLRYAVDHGKQFPESLGFGLTQIFQMVRRAGHYRVPRTIELPPKAEDNGDILESKWRSWVRQESFKRLV